MLAASDFPIEEALSFFTSYGLEAGFLVPTATGLKKSIMDAHAPLRRFLADAEVHDFASQAQGEQAKVIAEATVLGAFDVRDARVSLYRPETKAGDPRIWIYGLKSWAAEGNLLALFVADESLYITNLSDPAVWDSREDPDSPLGAALSKFESAEDRVAGELADALRAISARGWIDSMRSGDTGVGFTLESLLGIAANSNKAPDYKGIELKASRQSPGRPGKNRVTLFSQVPDWPSSHLSTARDLLREHGYPGEGGLPRLYVTTGKSPNSQGLFMTADDELVECMSYRDERLDKVVQWKLSLLQARLSEKHASTFWVKADVRSGPSGSEQFFYRTVIHSRAPLVANLGPLIESGKVTLDFTVKTRPGGSLKDHGYLFRMWPADFDLLFPPTRTLDLTVA